MKDLWKTVRLGVYVFALPLVAITAASAHQLISDSKPIETLVPDATAMIDVDNIGTLRSHTLAIDEDGAVRGRIVNIDASTKHAAGLGSLKVYFAQNGTVAYEIFTEADGSFVAENLAPGVYSFIAAGETGFAAYGVNIVEAGSGEFPNVMEAAAVSPTFSAVQNILNSHVPARVANEIVQTVNVEASSIAGANRVQLVDGDLHGNVVSIVGTRETAAGTFVHIVRNDEEIASVEVDNNGSFRIQDLDPGVYDFVAAGPSGFAAVGFEAVQDEVVGAVDSEIIETAIPESVVNVDASFADAGAAQEFIPANVPMDGGFDAGYYDPAMSLDVAMTAPNDGHILGDSVGYACDTCGGAPVSDGYISSPAEYAGQSVGCGCAAGGACGGASNFGSFNSCNCCGGGARGFGGGGRLFGGGGGGGGGLGRLVSLGLLGTAIAAIADDDNNGIPNTPSPINP